MPEWLVELFDPSDGTKSSEIINCDIIMQSGDHIVFLRKEAQTWRGRFEQAPQGDTYRAIAMINQALVVRVDMMEQDQMRLTENDLNELRRKR